MKVAEHVPSPTLTTFKVGGFVERVVTIESYEEIEVAVRHAQSYGVPVVPFGCGSNVLLPDGNLAITVLRYEPNEIARTGSKLRIAAGAAWDDVVTYAVTHSLWGIENLSAIPGTMGGAVVQNIGAYGASLSQVLCTVTAFDCVEHRIRTFHVSDCAFGYRQSRFKIERDRYLIVRAELELTLIESPNTSYADLARAFSDRQPTLTNIRSEVCRIRAEKFPPLDSIGSAGSYFLNPVTDDVHARALQNTFPDMPVFHLPEGGVKVPLGWYFDHVLHIRGYREGQVEAWRAQALVIAAHRGATASDVREFVKKISAQAENELGIVLEPEVREF